MLQSWWEVLFRNPCPLKLSDLWGLAEGSWAIGVSCGYSLACVWHCFELLGGGGVEGFGGHWSNQINKWKWFGVKGLETRPYCSGWLGAPYPREVDKQTGILWEGKGRCNQGNLNIDVNE